MNKQTAPSAKFWIQNLSGPVKLTIKPGQSITTEEHHATDEGWESSAETWQLSADGKRLTLDASSSGIDCDGRLDRFCTLQADADPRTFRNHDGHGFPQWQPLEASQRDHSAELAGY